MSEGLKRVLVLEKESKNSSGAAGTEDTPHASWWGCEAESTHAGTSQQCAHTDKARKKKQTKKKIYLQG